MSGRRPRVANSVMNWVWDHSRSRHAARLVLLALADRARRTAGRGRATRRLRRMTGLGERAVQTAVIKTGQARGAEVGYTAGRRAATGIACS